MKKYTSADRDAVLQQMFERLCGCASGTETSTVRLLEECGWKWDPVDEPELMQLHHMLFHDAVNYHLQLDMTDHEWMLQGRAYDRTYYVRQVLAEKN